MKRTRRLATFSLVFWLLCAGFLQAADGPRTEEPKKEEPRKEEPKKETPKKEEPKKETPRKEEPKKETPRQEPPKKVEPKKPLKPGDPGYYEELLRRRAEAEKNGNSSDTSKRRAEEEARKKAADARKKEEEARKKRQEEYQRKQENKDSQGRKEEPRKLDPRREEPRKDAPTGDTPNGETPATPGDAAIQRPALPSAGYGFAGIVRGTVLSRDGARLRIKVDAVESWPHSRASDGKSLIGREVAVEVDKGAFKEASQASPMLRYLELLQVGQSDTFDVNNRAGNVLNWLELSAKQRERLAPKAQ